VVPVRLAILGTRGVPPRYGGFETFAAELGRRLVARGHQVAVYCREPGDAMWDGIQRIVLPSIGHKYFETVSHALLSALDALRRDFDAVLVCNAANAFVLPLLRATRIRTAINVDGIERRRRKWNVLGKMVYAIGESFSAAFANAVIADAEVIAEYYRKHYAIEPHVIAYGSEFPAEEDSNVLERLGLQPDHYILYVSRFEPENNPEEVVNAYENLIPHPSSLIPLVMLGEARYDRQLAHRLQQHHSATALFPGALYGRDYRTLQRHARVYIQATEVGGTHPALIEAMGSNGVVLALDTPENREVGGDAVGYFRLRPAETLSGMLREWLADGALRATQRRRARQRAAEHYGWEAVTDAYEQLLNSL
jgi:glycosyltransferase involved in cell wall biosynthesis